MRDRPDWLTIVTVLLVAFVVAPAFSGNRSQSAERESQGRIRPPVQTAAARSAATAPRHANGSAAALGATDRDGAERPGAGESALTERALSLRQGDALFYDIYGTRTRAPICGIGISSPMA